MADVSYIVGQLNAAPFSMKLLEHKFSDLRGLDLLQKVRTTGVALSSAPCSAMARGHCAAIP